ncbi:MAG TPA: methylmalonyl-CoA mutase small subunit, partial [Porphyromonadaceae bacterium]|nr:methylmalonyl-CoA mutase small subunit [Porphyromonadaceae bacterium]
ISCEEVEIYFSTCVKKSAELVKLFAEYIEEKGLDKKKIQGSIYFDPVGKKMTCGKEIENCIDLYEEVVRASLSLPKFRVISINPIYFNNAGAYSYQELGFALAWGNDLIEKLSDKGIDVATIAKKIKFNFGIGSNYFMEIAKFRVAKVLWANIVMAYKPKCNNVDCKNRGEGDLCYCASKIKIHAETSSFNMTQYDAYVNLLRSQTEAMSACLAGVDSLEVKPFDAPFGKSDDFSERIARNQQLLLKEEAHFDKVTDPSAGSYYIENLTLSLAKQAWEVVLKIEEMGGFLKAMEEGYVVNEINKSGNERRLSIASRKESLLGTNQFPNFNEILGNKVEENSANASCHCEKKEGVEVLDFNRGALQFEQLRKETEQSPKHPKAFMLTIGNLAMRLARSQFSCNFFACAGYEVIDNLGFSSVKEGIEEARRKNADIIVLCSSDDEYATYAPEAKELLKGELLVVAGPPACMEELKSKGISEYIHVRSNVLETLKKYNSYLLNR